MKSIKRFLDLLIKLEYHPDYKVLAAIIEVICAIIAVAFAGGWIFCYDMLTMNDDWTKSDSIFYYSVNMFMVVFFGAIVQALISFFIVLAISIVICLCYHGWFIVLPLFLAFLGICFGRWIYVKNKQRTKAKG